LRLTDISVRALPRPDKGQKTYFDDALPSFGCRVSQGGTRSFVLQHGTDRRLITIGRYPIISLSEARTEAKRILAEHTLGRHRPQTITWDEALGIFLDACEQKNRPRTVRDYRRLLGRHFPFGKKRLSDITPQLINQRVDRLRHTVSEQNHALAAVKIFFRWALRRHYVEHSPCDGMQTIKRMPRNRVLSDRELAVVYAAAERIGYPFGSIVQLCILTGQRRTEVAWLRRSYLSKGTITLPSSLTKNKLEHVFPIAKTAETLIARIPHDADLLFPAMRGSGVFGGWSKQKAVLDTSIAEHGARIASWTLHDLRRTFATNLAALGIAPHIVERVLNHSSGTISGVAAIYNKFQYMDEMRAAIDAWESHLASLLAQHGLGNAPQA
jgi:integrase